MKYTPVELRHVRLRRGVLGYRRGAVDRLLADVVQSFEEVWRDRGELSDRVDQLEGELERHRDLERLLRETLVSAERAAHELKDQAKREAQAVLTEAHAQARSITAGALAQRERLRLETRRARALLTAALEVVSEADGAPNQPAGTGGEPAEAEAA